MKSELVTSPNEVQLSNDGKQHDNPPKMPMLHMWTDTDGISKVTETFMTGFGMKSIGGGADPQWLRPFAGDVKSIKFAVLPVGWVGDWHESPQAQWVIPIKGKWYLETQDGARAEMGPGDIHFGQDIGTKEVNGKKGHISGCLGEEPCFQMIVQFKESPLASTKNPF